MGYGFTMNNHEFVKNSMQNYEHKLLNDTFIREPELLNRTFPEILIFK